MKKHALKTSFIITLLIIILILVLGYTEVNGKEFFLGMFESFIRVSISYLISLSIALLIALIFSFSTSIENIFLPVLDVLQSFPSFALFPLLIVWFGRSSIVTIFILVVSMVWPILFTLVTAVKQIKQEFKDVAKIYGAINFKYIMYVVIPLLFPAIITGSIVAWGEAWETIIAAEIIVSVSGVGTYLATAGEGGHTNVLLIGILMLLLILFILNKYIWMPLLNKSTKYQEE